MTEESSQVDGRSLTDIRALAGAWIAGCLIVALAMGALALITEPVSGVDRAVAADQTEPR